MFDSKLFETATCPKCGTPLTKSQGGFTCASCKSVYPIKDGILYLSEPPEDVPMPKKPIEMMIKKENWSEWRTANHAHLRKFIDALSADAVVLDLAAGRSFYRDDFAKFKNFIATDFYPFEGIHVIADTSGKLPFKDNSFDAVFLSNVLEHMPDPEISIRECNRILKKGGVFVAQTPFLMFLHDEPYDFYRYTKYAARHLLEITGFERIEVENLSTFRDVYLSLNREFYRAMLDHSKEAGWPDIIARGYIRLLRKLNKLSVTLLPSGLKGVQDEKNPKGYGFSGYKK